MEVVAVGSHDTASAVAAVPMQAGAAASPTARNTHAPLPPSCGMPFTMATMKVALTTKPAPAQK